MEALPNLSQLVPTNQTKQSNQTKNKKQTKPNQNNPPTHQPTNPGLPKQPVVLGPRSIWRTWGWAPQHPWRSVCGASGSLAWWTISQTKARNIRAGRGPKPLRSLRGKNRECSVASGAVVVVVRLVVGAGSKFFFQI